LQAAFPDAFAQLETDFSAIIEGGAAAAAHLSNAHAWEKEIMDRNNVNESVDGMSVPENCDESVAYLQR